MISWSKIFRRRSEADLVEGIRHKLERFRDLVENNNRVLELMAQGGEMLGGEYIFDLQCLRTLASDLRESVEKVALDLGAISHDRYPRLVEISRRIHVEVQAILDSRLVVPKADYVIPMTRADEDLTDVVGAKMARLGAVSRYLGWRVPDGFVVSTHACQRFLEKAGIDPSGDGFEPAEVLGDEELVKQSDRLRRRILDARVPRDVARAVEAGVQLLVRSANPSSLAVRSSALGEDSEFSFAGQFLTVLGVSPAAVLDAYKSVVASLFTPEVMKYRQSHGLHPARGLMAVGCLSMIRARAGGVLYTLDPTRPASDVLIVSVAPGLAKSVVEGSEAADRFEISREPPHRVLSRHIARKERRYEVEDGGGVRQVEVAEQEQQRPAISDAELEALASAALAIEGHLKCAADIEWVLDPAGEIVILQARPLRITVDEPSPERDLADVASRCRALLKHRGTVACRGIGFGRVHVVENENELSEIPPGAVVVARTSSPKLAAAIVGASAVITDVGTTTGHLATIAREFRVPAIVDAEGATDILRGAGEVTVDSEENAVYEGRVPELLRHQLIRSSSSRDTREFRILRRMLRRTAPLNLRDPLSSSFAAENCVTYHDIIRFAHEKAVEELTEGCSIRPSGSPQHVRRLELPIPVDLLVIDLGGALRATEARALTPPGVASRPLRALLDGLLTEGVWAREPTAMDRNAFMASATRAALLTGPEALRPQQNLAIASAEYLNLNLRLGYHFNIVDCYASEKREENYIYFRFMGGVTELTRRSRRAELLKRILEKHGFLVESTGDLVVARLRKASVEIMDARLTMIGKLIGFTRQLDILLNSESSVDRYVDKFLEGRFGAEE